MFLLHKMCLATMLSWACATENCIFKVMEDCCTGKIYYMKALEYLLWELDNTLWEYACNGGVAFECVGEEEEECWMTAHGCNGSGRAPMHYTGQDVILPCDFFSGSVTRCQHIATRVPGNEDCEEWEVEPFCINGPEDPDCDP